MPQKFRVHQHVIWTYANNTAEGQIIEVFKEKVTRNIKGKDVTRNATDEEPAYLIEQKNGDQVLKSESELSKP